MNRYSYPLTANLSERAVAIARDGAGDRFVSGILDEDMYGIQADMLTLKHSRSDGTLPWENRYDGPVHGHDSPSAVTVDSLSNVNVTGVSEFGRIDTTARQTWRTRVSRWQYVDTSALPKSAYYRLGARWKKISDQP